MRVAVIKTFALSFGFSVLCGTALLAYQVSDRSSPASDIILTIMPPVIEQGEGFQIDVQVFYRRSCRAHVIRRLYDINGEKYTLPELNLPANSTGLQHSVSTIIVSPNFAPGQGRYISSPSYSCNWFQRVFWPITVPDRVAFFQVIKHHSD